MANSAPKVATKTSTRWTRDEVFELLCTLNLKIAEIKSQKDRPKDDEMRTVIIHATRLLSRSMTPEASALRLENKLAALWKELGDPNGDRKPYALYQYGAFTRTLPGLEDPKKGFPGMLNEIAEAVRKQQMSQMSLSQLVPERQRRSQRMTVRDASLDPLVCRCGFTQHIACIHCDQCFTWQHALCYYDTEVDEDLPKEHICDDCLGSNTFKAILSEAGSEESLARKFGRLSVDASTNPDSPRPRVPQTDGLTEEQGNTLGPFGLPRDGNFFWGPAEDEVISTMERLTSEIRQVVYSLLHVGVSVPNVKKILARTEEPDLSSLLEATHGTSFEAKIRGLVSQPVRSGIKIARMFMAMISAIAIDLVFSPRRTRSKTVDEMLSHLLCRNVLQMNGPQVLRDLRRKTLLSLLEKSHSQFAETTGEQADVLADQVLKLLCEMLPSSNGSTKQLAAAAEEVRSWKRILTQAFAMCLKLKTQLALSERLYELYTPPVGCVASEGLMMVDDCGEEIETGQTVEVCLMPAVVEYGAKDLGMDFDQFLLLSTEDIFVPAQQPERRSLGKIVSPAIVVPAA